MKDLEVIQKYLQKLDIEPETTAIYIELVKHGYSSALQLAKITKISRTQIYRHLEELETKGLVSAEKLPYGTIYRSLPIENIEGLIANREAETAALKRNLSSMASVLQTLAGSEGPKATVQHYYGVAGLKQVNWNLTKAKDEYRVFETAHLSQLLDKAFARRCREQYIERSLTSYDLTNSPAVTARELEPFEPSRTFFRYIDPKILTINFEILIYDDVVTLSDYKDEGFSAIEIHHSDLNTMMKQLFDAMWQQAKPIKIEP